MSGAFLASQHELDSRILPIESRLDMIETKLEEVKAELAHRRGIGHSRFSIGLTGTLFVDRPEGHAALLARVLLSVDRSLWTIIEPWRDAPQTI